MLLKIKATEDELATLAASICAICGRPPKPLGGGGIIGIDILKTFMEEEKDD